MGVVLNGWEFDNLPSEISQRFTDPDMSCRQFVIRLNCMTREALRLKRCADDK